MFVLLSGYYFYQFLPQTYKVQAPMGWDQIYAKFTDKKNKKKKPFEFD